MVAIEHDLFWLHCVHSKQCYLAVKVVGCLERNVGSFMLLSRRVGSGAVHAADVLRELLFAMT